MISVEKKELCTGCGACKNVCPKNSIKFIDDPDGFWYPEVDLTTCVNCKLCERVCPFNDDKVLCRDKVFENVYYAGQLNNKEELFEVSSGGAAWALAQSVIECGGVVYGAEQVGVDIVRHIRTEYEEDAKKTRRSKYFQSDTGMTFRTVKDDLENGRKVLYTGVGCQIAGLKKFLGKEYNNLITADVVCHGVPSRKVWKSYRKFMENKNHSDITDLVFRDKSAGWSKNQYKLSFEDGLDLYEKSVDNPFHRGYLEGMYSRPSCGACRFNSIPRISDYTFADYWEYDGEEFQNTREDGVSLISVNSKKGFDNLFLFEERLSIEMTTEEKALHSARHLNNAPSVSNCRNRLLEEITDDNFLDIWERYIKPRKVNIIVRIIRKVKGFF